MIQSRFNSSDINKTSYFLIMAQILLKERLLLYSSKFYLQDLFDCNYNSRVKYIGDGKVIENVSISVRSRCAVHILNFQLVPYWRATQWLGIGIQILKEYSTCCARAMLFLISNISNVSKGRISTHCAC